MSHCYTEAKQQFASYTQKKTFTVLPKGLAIKSHAELTLHNSNNQLTTRGTANLFDDLNGNMTSDGTNSYVWNARNQLSQGRETEGPG